MTEEVKTMKYDPNDRKFFFNEEKILSSESAVACRKNYDSWQKDTINNLPGVIVDYLKDEDGRLQGSMVLGSFGTVCVFVGIIAIVMCFIVKRYDIAAWIICAIIAFFGAVLFAQPTTRAKAFEEGVFSRRIQGLILLIGAIIIAVLRLISGYKNAGNSVYREAVDAKVIGYIRTYEHYDEMSVISKISPVFEYYFEGNKYQSYLDVLDTGDNGKLDVGSSCKIKISPDDPEKVMGDSKNFMDGPVVFTVLCFVAAVILLVMML